jgi:hypothetical protein
MPSKSKTRRATVNRRGTHTTRVMREVAHEIGRRQLIGVLTLLERQKSTRVNVIVIGDAYRTAARTAYSASAPRRPSVHYDGVLGFTFEARTPTITCLIESKAGRKASTIKKLPAHLRSFLINAYCVMKAWEDVKTKHRPLFLFVSAAPFESDLLENGLLDVKKAATSLKEAGLKKVNAKLIQEIRQNLRVFEYGDWLEALIG